MPGGQPLAQSWWGPAWAWAAPALVTVAAELPVTIFLGRHGFMEPYVSAGTLLVSGLGAPAFAGSFGYRLGVSF